MNKAQEFSAEERMQYIGASEFAACLGMDPYKTKLDIYNVKTGIEAPFEGNRHTERGNRLEKIAADLWTELDGRKLRRKSDAYIHPEHKFLVGHIDRIVVGEKAIAEIKCPSLAAWRKIKEDGLPAHYYIQMQGYLGLSGYPKGVFILFCADQMDIITFDVDFDQQYYDASVDAAAKLWNEHIVPRVPPTSADGDKPKLDFERIGGEVEDMSANADWIGAAEALREAADLKAQGEELFNLAKKQILSVIGDKPGKYSGAGLKLAYSEVAGRKTLDKKMLAAEHPEIELALYEKQGAPYKMFRPFFSAID